MFSSLIKQHLSNLPQPAPAFLVYFKLSLVMMFTLGALSMVSFLSLLLPLNLNVFVLLWVVLPWFLLLSKSLFSKPLANVFWSLLNKQPMDNPSFDSSNHAFLNFIAHCWGASFSIGAALALIFGFAFKDIPFSWSTSINGMDGFLLAFYQLIDFPWSWFEVASFDQKWFIDAKNANASLNSIASNSQGLNSIWLYVCCVFLSYHLIPKILLVLFSSWQLKCSLLNNDLQTNDQDSFIEKASNNKPLDHAEISNPVLTDAQWFFWQVTPDAINKTGQLIGLKSWNDDVALLKQTAGDCYITVQAMQSPTFEMIDLLKKGEQNLMAIVLVDSDIASKGQLQSWQQYALKFDVPLIDSLQYDSLKITKGDQ